MFKSIAALCLVATAATARTVTKDPYALGWQQATDADAAQQVKFTVVVKEQGMDEIRSIVTQVSDPDSALYGKYLSQDTIDEITRPLGQHMEAVTSWLSSAGADFEKRGVSNVDVTTNVATAEQLLATKFHVASHLEHDDLIRAGEYTIPDEVDDAVATIFGLHGLPLPKTQVTQPGMPVTVTPEVIYSTYSVTEPKVTRSPKNRQAVAEFQGQFMNSSDLKVMFKALVKNYEVGVDDVVTKFVGEHEENSGGIEAELDIQYIMGVSPGIQTEFFEFPGQDFGADLNMWTSNLTSTDDCPLVHSVSYGWQGNLSQIGVKESDVEVVDNNFAKLASKGISIMISSGDSGSGYAPTNVCMNEGEKGVGIDGDVLESTHAFGYSECCEMGSEHSDAAGWTFKVDKSLDAFASGTIIFKKSPYHDVLAQGSHPIFKPRELFELTGTVKNTTGGKVIARSLNKTVKAGEITFSAGMSNPAQPQVTMFNVTGAFSGIKIMGRAQALTMPGIPMQIFDFQWFCKDEPNSECYLWERGPNPPPPPPPPPAGTCTIYKTVTSRPSADPTTASGFPGKSAVVLWASWPASSPYVTAVGATRFIGQKVGNEEMATDQFGSGGGFSSMFTQENAVYQKEAVAKYLSTVEKSTLPPAGAFNPEGRATPDVAALGEGFEVFADGKPIPGGVGGTSASSPTFAGLMSLVNEARLNAGKPAMGFLNPFLYKNADAFFDVTVGSDKVSRGGGALPYGYNCSAGWDPVTGLGTPHFDKIMAAAMKA